MRTNTASTFRTRTHEGASVPRVSAMTELRRTASACLLFEDTFYESGVDIATRIADLVHRVPLLDALRLAQDLRHKAGLRHAPLWMLNAALGHPQRHDHSKEIATVIANVAGSRGDLPGELLAMYWKDGKRPLAKALKNGLAAALRSFSSYGLQKYAARGPIRLRDVLFLTHAKPRDDAQAEWFKMLADDTMPAADTWEVKLSGGADKRETFESMLAENKLGALAVLRNLRNMHAAGVPRAAVEAGLRAAVAKAKFGVLPFQFVAASRAVPSMEPAIEQAMIDGVVKLRDEGMRLDGRAAILIDVSASMSWQMSGKSTLNRCDAAGAMAILLREVCSDVRVFDYNDSMQEVPARRGFALRDAIRRPNGGTRTGAAARALLSTANEKFERLIIVTDEQSRDPLPPLPKGVRGYVMNVAPYQNGIAWGDWITVSGFSENLVKFIVEIEGGLGA